MEGILRGREGKFFLWPLISLLLKKVGIWKFFCKGPPRGMCFGKILAPLIERGMRGRMLSDSPNFGGSISVLIRSQNLWGGSVRFIHQDVKE